MLIQGLDQFNPCLAKLALIFIRRHNVVSPLMGLQQTTQALLEIVHLLFTQIHMFDRY